MLEPSARIDQMSMSHVDASSNMTREKQMLTNCQHYSNIPDMYIYMSHMDKKQRETGRECKARGGQKQLANCQRAHLRGNCIIHILRSDPR